MNLNHPFLDFVSGGVSAILAITCVHPIDVVKSRLQVKSEKLSNTKSTLYNKNVFSLLIKIGKDEGYKALYSGISAAYLLQFSVTATRFGFFSLSKSILNKNDDTKNISLKSTSKNFVLAGLSGSLSAVIGSPFFALKTRMQIHSNKNEFKVGYQNQLKNNVFLDLLDIYKLEGIKGYFRGVDAFILRVTFYGAANLTSYDLAKRKLKNDNYVKNDGLLLHAISASIASFFSVVTIQPFDFIAVRLMNQPIDPITKRGLYYKNSFDCLIKSIKNDSIIVLYNGFTGNYFRFTPYVILQFMFLEKIKPVFYKLVDE